MVGNLFYLNPVRKGHDGANGSCLAESFMFHCLMKTSTLARGPIKHISTLPLPQTISWSAANETIFCLTTMHRGLISFNIPPTQREAVNGCVGWKRLSAPISGRVWWQLNFLASHSHKTERVEYGPVPSSVDGVGFYVSTVRDVKGVDNLTRRFDAVRTVWWVLPLSCRLRVPSIFFHAVLTANLNLLIATQNKHAGSTRNLTPISWPSWSNDSPSLCTVKVEESIHT